MLWEFSCLISKDGVTDIIDFGEDVSNFAAFEMGRVESFKGHRLGLGGLDVLPLLGEIPHDGLVRIGTIPCGIGVCETIEGVTISCPDGIEPRLLDREA